MSMQRLSTSGCGIFAAAILLQAGAASAEPYIAARTGLKCSQCHVNRTGGGKRTDYGEVFTQYKLLIASPLMEGQPYSFDPKLNKVISVGANFRIEQTYTRPYTSKPVNPGDSAKTAESVWDPGSFKEKNLYVQVDLVKDWLKLYYDKDMGGGAARELWAMANFGENAYAKFGQMLLPYGFRLMDDEAFVRKGTGYTYGTTALAYEMGYEPGPLSLTANVTETELATVGSLVFNRMPVIRAFRFGGSYSYQLKKKMKDKKGSYGVFGSASLGMLTFLGERDWTKDDGIDKIEDYLEMDFLPAQGWNFKAVLESLWPDTRIPRGQINQTRLTVGAEPFVTQFLQIGLYYRLNEWIPQNTPKNQDQIVGRLHVFF
jgi:hypothetical protein